MEFTEKIQNFKGEILKSGIEILREIRDRELAIIKEEIVIMSSEEMQDAIQFPDSRLQRLLATFRRFSKEIKYFHPMIVPNQDKGFTVRDKYVTEMQVTSERLEVALAEFLEQIDNAKLQMPEDVNSTYKFYWEAGKLNREK